jgi:hypothetical protein
MFFQAPHGCGAVFPDNFRKTMAHNVQGLRRFLWRNKETRKRFAP